MTPGSGGRGRNRRDPAPADRQSRRDRGAHHPRRAASSGSKAWRSTRTPTRRAAHVAAADRAVAIGPPPPQRELPVDRRIIDAAREAGADASTRATDFSPRTHRFAAACERRRADLRRSARLGASPRWARRSRRARMMQAAGVPDRPWRDAGRSVGRRRSPARSSASAARPRQGVGRRRRQGHAARRRDATSSTTRFRRRGAKRWRRSATARCTSSG